jgi:hypothetical protein
VLTPHSGKWGIIAAAREWAAIDLPEEIASNLMTDIKKNDKGMYPTDFLAFLNSQGLRAFHPWRVTTLQGSTHSGLGDPWQALELRIEGPSGGKRIRVKGTGFHEIALALLGDLPLPPKKGPLSLRTLSASSGEKERLYAEVETPEGFIIPSERIGKNREELLAETLLDCLNVYWATKTAILDRP